MNNSELIEDLSKYAAHFIANSEEATGKLQIRGCSWEAMNTSLAFKNGMMAIISELNTKLSNYVTPPDKSLIHYAKQIIKINDNETDIPLVIAKRFESGYPNKYKLKDQIKNRGHSNLLCTTEKTCTEEKRVPIDKAVAQRFLDSAKEKA
ncbi:MAG: hypothetical protein GY804_10420 [Alphaproteobacteria bacterium]|nr:hypothetical protein [Alphaproteobacteria bacterium]